MSSFAEFGLAPTLLERLTAMGITTPSPVQAAALPALFEGRDALVAAQTGTGKTLAYLLPMLARIDREKAGVQGLVLVPTQELAIQVRDVVRELTQDAPVGAVALIGGANPAHQIAALKKQAPRLVVGTPGRILEFIRTQRLSGAFVRTLVVDEADHLTENAKQKDVEAILRATSPSRQTIFCSATLGDAAAQWARKFLKEPAEIRVEPETRLPKTLTHVAFTIDPRRRIEFIRKLVHHYKPEGAIAFVNGAEDLPLLVDKLRYHQVKAAGLHGGVKKLERARIMQDFRAGRLQILIATDLAARGLDLQNVKMVFNFDLPTDAAHFTHRVGRTGRMGQEGLTITLTGPKEAFVLEKIERALDITFERPVFREGEMREATEADQSRDELKQKAAVRKERAEAKAKADFEAGIAPKRVKKPKHTPTARQLAKGKAKKATKKANKAAGLAARDAARLARAAAEAASPQGPEQA